MSKSKSDLRNAEALGEIKSLPLTAQEEMLEIEEISEQIDNPEEFRLAIGNAQMDGKDYVEVSERLFKHLLKNSKSKYLTYGSPGIKVFKYGTREDIESEESLNAEQYHEFISKKKLSGHA